MAQDVMCRSERSVVSSLAATSIGAVEAYEVPAPRGTRVGTAVHHTPLCAAGQARWRAATDCPWAQTHPHRQAAHAGRRQARCTSPQTGAKMPPALPCHPWGVLHNGARRGRGPIVGPEWARGRGPMWHTVRAPPWPDWRDGRGSVPASPHDGEVMGEGCAFFTSKRSIGSPTPTRAVSTASESPRFSSSRAWRERGGRCRSSCSICPDDSCISVT